MKRKNRKKHSIRFQSFLYLILFVWTGILLWAGCKQYSASERLQEYMVSKMTQTGEKKANLMHYLQTNSSKTQFAKNNLKQTSYLDYLIQNEEKLTDCTDQSVTAMAGLFSGKNKNDVFWSTAASRKQMEHNLFYRSDKTITALKEEGKQEKSSKEAAGYDEKEEFDSKKIAVPTQNILLFQNGSPDITAKNKKTTVEEKEEGKKSADNICDSSKQLEENRKQLKKLKNGYSRSYLLGKFYITDSSTSIDNAVFRPRELVQMNLTLQKSKRPQILILHTHAASEAFRDSRKGKKEDSIVGVGDKLAQILSEKYGYQVLHDRTEYDRINGRIDRNKAYNNAYNGLKKTLKKYPSIQVVIDLHRDGVGNQVKRTTVVHGKRTAQVMFFNGLSRNASGNIEYLYNENLQGNLAFSLQLKMACMERFQNFARPVYLKSYRYNMHLRKRYTLIELGNENNTVQEAKNAALPIAMALDAVLQKK